MLRAQLSRKRAIVILHDGTQPDQIRPLLPLTGQSLILITTRRALPGLEGADTLSLDVLPSTDAITPATPRHADCHLPTGRRGSPGNWRPYGAGWPRAWAAARVSLSDTGPCYHHAAHPGRVPAIERATGDLVPLIPQDRLRRLTPEDVRNR